MALHNYSDEQEKTPEHEEDETLEPEVGAAKPEKEEDIVQEQEIIEQTEENERATAEVTVPENKDEEETVHGDAR